MTDAFDATNDATYDRRYVEVSSGQNYDNIGNRFKSRIGTGSGTPVSTYFPNELNQYDTVTQTNPVSGRGFLYDADGNMTASYVAMDIDGDGDVDSTDLSMMSAMYGYTCSTWTGDMAEFLRGDIDGDCDIDINDWGVLLSLYGTTGDLSLEHQFTWDAENRLTKIEPVSPTSGSKRIEFKYDYRGRRVEKTVTLWNTGTSPAAWYAYPAETRRFVWNGWLMLRETIETDGNSDGDLLDGGDSTRTKTYTWGKDLANGGSRGGTGVSPVMRGGTGVSPVMLESAGGIGGLLAVYDDNATTTGGGPTADDLAYVYLYDANGNVGQLCDLSATGGPGVPPGALVATYEYDAYGNVTASGGAYVSANTYRFSTKPRDDETGLGYWGYRYYDPRLGRWMSRDPIEEAGCDNLQLFDANCPTVQNDVLGLQVIFLPPCYPSPGGPFTCRDDTGADRTCPTCALICLFTPNYGLATCNGSMPCCCTCGQRIDADFPSGGPKGDPRINRGARICIESHERRHLRDLNCGGHPATPISREERECRAFGQEARCWKAQPDLKSCANDPTCKPKLEDVINEFEAACQMECVDDRRCRNIADSIRKTFGIPEKGPFHK